MMKTIHEIATLLKELGEGKTVALTHLYDAYADKVFRFAFKMTHDTKDAEDIVQNIFIKVWENRSYISKVDSFDAYLFKMTKYAVFDYFDHKLIQAKFAHKAQQSVKYDLSLDERMNANDLELLIAIEIEKMPVQRRTIFKMSREEGYSNQEIALKLGLSVNTIESHMSLALRDLRKSLAALI